MATTSMGEVIERNEENELFVYPLCGVIYNVRDGGANSHLNLKQHFALFHPETAQVLGRMGLVTFKAGSEGLKDALAFEQWFIHKCFGKKDWEMRSSVSYPYGPGMDLYGWLARKEDYDGMGGEGDAHVDSMLIAEHLKDTGSYLSDVAIMSLCELQSQMSEREVEVLYTTEDIKMQVEERHKKELEEVETRAQQSLQEQTQEMQEINSSLQTTVESLRNDIKHLEDELRKTKDEIDKSVLDHEKNENSWQLDLVNQQNEMQKYQLYQVKLNKQREEQSKRLEELFLQDRFLTEQHQLSLQSLEELSDTKELNDKLKSMEKQKEQIERQLVDLRVANDLCTDKLNALIVAERIANGELQEARNFAITEISQRGSDANNIMVRKMGEIDDAPWKMAYQRRHVSRDNRWQQVWNIKYSEWQARVQDHNFNPFKTIQIGEENNQERQVDWDNEYLLALKFELGDEVCQSVVTALTELEEYNASGRYPVRVLWNREQNRKATLKEVLEAMELTTRRVRRRTPNTTPNRTNRTSN